MFLMTYLMSLVIGKLLDENQEIVALPAGERRDSIMPRNFSVQNILEVYDQHRYTTTIIKKL